MPIKKNIFFERRIDIFVSSFRWKKKCSNSRAIYEFSAMFMSIVWPILLYFRAINRSTSSSMDMSGGHVIKRRWNRPSFYPESFAKAVWHEAMAQGVNPADTDLEAISQHRRAITPLRLSESRFEHGFRRGMLTLIRPHGLIAFENGEKCEPGALRVTVCRGFSHPSKCKRYHHDNFVAAC